MQNEYGEKKERIDAKDFFQIAAGALAAAILIAPSQELLYIAADLPFYKLIIIFFLSLAVSGIIAYKIGARKVEFNEMQKIGEFIPVRIVVIYVISAFSCLLVLWLYDIISINDIFTNYNIVIKQVVVLSLIACGSGSLVDLAYSKNK